MFWIVPQSEAYIFDDAQFFDTETEAYENALDWSIEMNGITINVGKGKNVIAQVWA
jgi:hypothetical protein